MNAKLRFTVISVLLAASISACNEKEQASEESKPIEPELSGGVAYVEGEPGRIEQYSAEVVASVIAIDHDSREMTIEDDKGGQKTLTVPKTAVNFDQIEKGDRVRMKIIEETIIQLSEPGAAPVEQASAELVGKAPEGEKPTVVLAEQNLITATVMSLDYEAHTATIQFEDGTEKTVPVRPDVKFDDAYIGREVVILSTQAMAIAVDKVTE